MCIAGTLQYRTTIFNGISNDKNGFKSLEVFVIEKPLREKANIFTCNREEITSRLHALSEDTHNSLLGVRYSVSL